MNSHLPMPSDAELDRLLRDCGERIVYPPTSDVIDATLRRLDRAPRGSQTQSPGGSWSDAGPLLVSNLPGQAGAGTLLDDLPGRRRGLRGWTGQALKLAAGILAFAAVTVLLALVFRSFGDGQPAIAPPGEPELVTQERLYVVSLVNVAEDDSSLRLHGRVTAYNAETGEELYAIDTGDQVEAVLSQDGSRLFIASMGQGGDDLIAVDAATGRELWRTSIQDRVHWIMSHGPPTMAVSPDGQRLYVYSSDATGIVGDASAIPYRIQVFDANTGDWIADIDTANCPARLHVSPNGEALYMICHERIGLSSAIDLETGEPIAGIELPLAANGTAVSSDGRQLYIVSGGRATVVDMDERAVVDIVPLELDTSPARLLRLVSLSLDGTRLFVGLGTDIDPGSSAVSSREIAIFDTSTWQEIERITTEEMPVNGQTLAAAPDDRSVFAVHNAFREGTSIPPTASILKLSPDTEPVIFATREREEVLALIAGRIIMR